MRLLAHQIVALGGQPHGQDIVGKPRRLAPCRRQRGVDPDQLLVPQDLHPRTPVRIRPDRVEDPGEVRVDPPASFLQEMWQQLRQLVMRERPLRRIQQLIPPRLRRGSEEALRDELVPRVELMTTTRAHRPGQHVQQNQSPCRLPAAQIARRRSAPDMRRKPPSRVRDLPRQTHDGRGGNATLLLRELRSERCVVYLDGLHERIEARLTRGCVTDGHVPPVGPVTNEPGIEPVLVQDHRRHGEQHRGLGPRERWKPLVSHARRIRQPGVHHTQARPVRFSLDDPLGVRVEVVSRLQMGRQEKNEPGVPVVRRGPVSVMPEHVAQPRTSRAYVGVGVMTVDSPRLKRTLHDVVVPRATHMVHHLLAASLLDGLSNARSQIGEHRLPRDALPLSAPARTHSLHGIQDAIGILNLLQHRRSLGAEASPARRVERVPLESNQLSCRAIQDGQ